MRYSREGGREGGREILDKFKMSCGSPPLVL